MEAVGTRALTVTEYATQLARAVRAVGPAVLEGEVQERQAGANGILRFSLTDGDSTLRCKVFSGQARRLEHSPADGDLVQVAVERPDMWTRNAAVALIVAQVRLAGQGELLLRRRELIARLRAEGLCDPDRRRPRPSHPRAVGVIAGRDSDALADVIRALADRWPAVHVVACASLVQGKRAPADIVGALACLQEHPLVDVIVLARGGGSVQDLVCFDDEGLCRAIFACAVPVVCAVGHTQNNPVCNHVAWAAFTPSRSAELVVPSATEMRGSLARMRDRLEGPPGRLAVLAERVEAAARRMDIGVAVERRSAAVRECAGAAMDAGAVLARLAGEVGERAARLGTATHRQHGDHARDYGRALVRLLAQARRTIERRGGEAGDGVRRESALLAERGLRRVRALDRETVHAAALIAAHDFRERGWLLASSGGARVRSIVALEPGTGIELELHDGRAEAVIERVKTNLEMRADD